MKNMNQKDDINILAKQDIKCLEDKIKKQEQLLKAYHHSYRFLISQFSDFRFELEKTRIVLHNTHKFRSSKIIRFLELLYYVKQGQLPNGMKLSHAKKRAISVYKEEGALGVYRKAILVFPIIHRIVKKICNISIVIDDTEKKDQEENLNRNLNLHRATSSIDIHENRLNTIVDYQYSVSYQPKQYPLILIIAEITLPQCYKYRIQQKVEHFERLGWICKVVDWRRQVEAFSALQTCTHVIFYRVPGFPDVLKQITEAKRLGLKPYWEVDDLIFDQDLYMQCGFMKFLSKAEIDLLLFGSDLFYKAMLACDRGIASTTSLAYFMKQAGLKEVNVIENALDHETLKIASQYYPIKHVKTESIKNPNEIVILYGSGTNTHTADFLVASQGILSALEKNSFLRLWIVGQLHLPEKFHKVKKQVKYISSKSYEEYLRLLSEADIAIAPLEAIHFNDAKSNIKYLEASILGIPSVCSSRRAFTDVISNAENGFLADTATEWEKYLLLLAGNNELRKEIGAKAYQTVLDNYVPEVITQKQVEPIFGYPQFNSKEKLKILVVNVHYDPYSYGGATLVAEAMTRKIQQSGDVEVSVFTTREAGNYHHGLRRYENNGSDIYSVAVNKVFSDSQQFLNVEITESFDQVLKAVRPDIVHFHAIQTMGLEMVFACQNYDIPYMITLHDSWWLCNRFFMVNSDGKYCFQKKINLTVCQYCEVSASASYLSNRFTVMQQALQGASLLLSPSDSHRQLYIANDVDPENIKVNRNGIARPKSDRPVRPKGLPLRFGFVAGDEVIKGFKVIKDAFKSLSRSDWELHIIDSKVHMGHPSIQVDHWGVKGNIKKLSPYDEQTKDDFFYGIDVLLFPSQWKESYGMTVREALLRDVWVICSHPGGQSEDVIDGVNGNYISLTGDVEELKMVIENLLDHASMFDDYVNPHKDHIATLDGQAEELLKYYHSIIPEHIKEK